MASKIGVAYTLVAAVVGHVVICTKGADYAVRGIEWAAARLEQRRAKARSQKTGVVIDGEFRVVERVRA